MFKSQQYRAKAAEYGELVKGSTGSDQSSKLQELQEHLASLADNEQGQRTTMTVPCKLRSRTDPAARPLRTKKSTFCAVLVRPSSCNGTPCRRRCNGRYSTPPDRSESCWRRRHSAGRSPDFFTSTRMMPVATNPRKSRVAMRGWSLGVVAVGRTREAQSATNRRCEETSTRGGIAMPLTQSRVDDGPHNMDGLRLYARDGYKQVEAFIGRKVMDVWANSVEHRGGRQRLFRDQYNALGKLNLAAIQRIVSRNTSGARHSTANIPLSRFYSRTLRRAARNWI